VGYTNGYSDLTNVAILYTMWIYVSGTTVDPKIGKKRLTRSKVFWLLYRKISHRKCFYFPSKKKLIWF